MEPDEPGRRHDPGPTLYPIGFAAGVVCLLIGLIVSPRLIAPIGAAITIVFAFLWIRDATKSYRGKPEQVEPERRPGRGEATEDPAQEPAPASSAERFPRNRFLEGATLGLGALIGLIVTAPVAAMALGPAFGKQQKVNVDLGPLTDYPEGEWRIATFMLDPAQGEISRRTAFVRNNGLLDGKPSFTLISNRCVHLGCPVQPNGPVFDNTKQTISTGGGEEVTLIKMLPAGGFGCPCHGGQYTSEGNRTAGPPVRSLDRYEYSIVNGRLIIGSTFSVANVEGTGKDALIEKYRRAGPGQHVDGWEQIFYPLQPPS